MKTCGLLGKKLGHSYSPIIHSMLASYEYSLFEKSESELEDFLKNGAFSGLNVTIPYKKAVLPFVSEMSESVKRTGSANTIVRRKDGSLYADNTDVYGFIELVKHSKISVKGKKVLVLGSGGASAAVVSGLSSLLARPVVISRTGENNYNNLHLNKDAEIIVNTTPLGMYPDNGSSPIDLSFFNNLSGVIDIIYNPALTSLLLQAESLNIPHIGGLYMLVAQAKKSAELFSGEKILDEKISQICSKLSVSMKNIVLTGMPGCGKSTIASILNRETRRPIFDSDSVIEKTYGTRPSEIITKRGENAFREIETSVLKELGKKSASIIATGGGAVTRSENYPLLHQNGIIVYIKRDIKRLATFDRPLSQNNLELLFRE
ncbi:MAG: shikimate kinase, partial [Clostridia bacterium]|nr:shikimate kinase [Clostridia bacterium]